MIYDADGIFAGWRPYDQFDLSAEEDSAHCVYSNDFNCPKEESRGHAINGQDPYYPWFSLGTDTGFESIRLPEPVVVNGDTMHYMYKDKNVVDGLEYTYSVVAYDMGVEPPYVETYQDIGNGQYEVVVDTNYSNPGNWASPDGYASIENSKGTTVLDRNFVKVYPGVRPVSVLKEVGVVPNPYKVNSDLNEEVHKREIRFTKLTENCTINIFTITGELVSTIEHNNADKGETVWDMRTVNNQEAAPGLYLYHVENQTASNEKIGKFAIIR